MSSNREATTEKGERQTTFRYSPERRTALVFCGTGAHGAYHAGALRALQEAGVKVDVMAGQGIGAGAAVLAAIDGAARLWDAAGLWGRGQVAALYGWKWPLRAAGWLTLILGITLCIPLVFLALGLIVYPAGFLLEIVGSDAGGALVGAYTEWLQIAMAGANLPVAVPRLVLIEVALLVLVLGIGVAIARWRAPAARTAQGGWWWRMLAAPLDAGAARKAFAGTVWHLIRGADRTARPAMAVLGRRYADVLAESLGQPGFRELMIVATDLDARRDVVAGLLREPYRRDFLARSERGRRSEVLDLAGIGREHALDVAAAALTPPVVCDPYLVTFAADSLLARRDPSLLRSARRCITTSRRTGCRRCVAGGYRQRRDLFLHAAPPACAAARSASCSG